MRSVSPIVVVMLPSKSIPEPILPLLCRSICLNLCEIFDSNANAEIYLGSKAS